MNRRAVLHLLWATPLALTLAACGGKSGADAPGAATAASAAAGPAAAASSPPVTVSVVVAAQRDFPVAVRATGTVAPLSSVEVKPQLASVVTQVHVQEGQFVRAGE